MANVNMSVNSKQSLDNFERCIPKCWRKRDSNFRRKYIFILQQTTNPAHQSKFELKIRFFYTAEGLSILKKRFCLPINILWSRQLYSLAIRLLPIVCVFSTGIHNGAFGSRAVWQNCAKKHIALMWLGKWLLRIRICKFAFCIHMCLTLCCLTNTS